MNKDLKTILSPLNDYLEEIDNIIQSQFQSGIPILDESALAPNSPVEEP